MERPAFHIQAGITKNANRYPKASLCDFGLSEIVDDGWWCKHWKLIKKAALTEQGSARLDQFVDAGRRAFLQLCVNIRGYLEFLVLHPESILPAEEIVDNQQESVWLDHLLEQTFVIERFSCMKKDSRTFVGTTDDAGIVRLIQEELDHIRDTVMWSYMTNIFYQWNERRRDDIIGCLDDGYWSSDLRRSVLMLLTYSTTTWNGVLMTIDDYEQFSSEECPAKTNMELSKLTLAEWGEMYEDMSNHSWNGQFGNSGKLTALIRWFTASGGLPLVPPKHVYQTSSLEFSARIGSAAKYPWECPNLVRVSKEGKPWVDKLKIYGSDRPMNTMTLTGAWKLCQYINIHQTRLDWNPFLDWLCCHFLWNLISQYVCGSSANLDVQNVSDQDLQEDLLEFSRLNNKQMVVRDDILLLIERNFRFWIGTTELSYRFTCASTGYYDIDHAYAVGSVDYDLGESLGLEKSESTKWTQRTLQLLMEIKESTKFRDILRESFTTIATGYTVLPGAMEEYVQARGRIASKKYIDLIFHTRSTDARSIILMIFDPNSAVHVVVHGVGFFNPDLYGLIPFTNVTLPNEERDAMSVTASNLVKNSAPLVAAELKAEVYHVLLPVLYLQLTKRLKISGALLNVLQKPGTSNNSSTSLEALFAADLEKIAISTVRSGKHRKTSRGGDHDLKGVMKKFIDARYAEATTDETKLTNAQEFEKRVFVICYCIRALGSKEDCLAKHQLDARLRGGLPPTGYSEAFFAPMKLAPTVVMCPRTGLRSFVYHDAPITSHGDAQPWMVTHRGEHWICTPGQLFVRTRNYLQALKTYTKECKRVLDDNAQTVAIDRQSSECFI